MADIVSIHKSGIERKARSPERFATGETMTIQGTVNKTGLLLLFVVVTAAWTWGAEPFANP